jgi:tRNA threonylcarbamoyl adenosine modification protein (Sua5/YciO/YrdC/YwlC family)
MRQWQISDAPTAVQLAEIAKALRGGAVVLMPTDTIYGLHAAFDDEAAVARIAAMKGRDERKPFIVLAASIAQLTDLGISADPEVLQMLDSIWPAPLTAILPRGGGGSLAVRIPALDWLRELVERSGPLVSTSANRSGEPPVDRPEILARDLHEQLDALVDGGLRSGEPSTILDLTGDEPRFIREGSPAFTQKLRKTLRKTT